MSRLFALRALPQLKTEFKALGQQAAVVFAGQLAVVAFGVADTMIAARHSEAALAALSVGTAVYISVYVGLMSLLQALLPVWAELRGAGQRHQLGASVRQALHLCALASVLGMAALLMPGPLLRALHVPAALQEQAAQYLAVLAWGLPPALLFRLYSTLNQSLGLPRLVTALQVGALLPKLGLSAWLALGGAGLPALGAVGCALATLIVNYALLAVALGLLRSSRLYAPYALWARLPAPDWRQLARFLQLGVPAALAVMVEVSSFALMALFVARLGERAAASHQVAASVAAVLYMAPLALGIATSARISYWLGAGQPDRARQATGLGLGVALALALISALALLLTAPAVARIYTGDEAVAAAAAALLMGVAAYHLGDAMQALCLFALRSYHVNVRPMLLYAAWLWGLGLPAGRALALEGMGPWPAWQSPLAMWVCMAAAQALTALSLLALLRHVMRRLPQSAPAA